MIVLNDIHHTGRSFKGDVVLPTHEGPLRFKCSVDGPADLDPAFVKRALVGHAARQRNR